MSAVNFINSAVEKRTVDLAVQTGRRVRLFRQHPCSQEQVCKSTRLSVNYTSMQQASLLGCSTQALTTAVYQDDCLFTKIQKEYRGFLLSVTSVILLLRTQVPISLRLLIIPVLLSVDRPSAIDNITLFGHQLQLTTCSKNGYTFGETSTVHHKNGNGNKFWLLCTIKSNM